MTNMRVFYMLVSTKRQCNHPYPCLAKSFRTVFIDSVDVLQTLKRHNMGMYVQLSDVFCFQTVFKFVNFRWWNLEYTWTFVHVF